VHHIAFATATTDQCSVALFRAPAPALALPNEDDNVRKIYGGGPAKSASHFVARYSSDVPARP
jgi:hypothetical protein